MPAVTSFRELLDRYQLGERDFAGSELGEDPENDLSGVCLDGIDLSKSFIFAGFERANLREARFVGANVKTCDFRGADLTAADFSNAALCATTFVGAQLADARFDGAYYHSHVLNAGERPDW